MHEFSLAVSILECALKVSRYHGDAPVQRIVVEIGTLQAVIPDSLQFAFEAATEETVAAGAVLEWREIPAEVECPACAKRYSPDDFLWICPQCNTAGGRVLSGDELIIKSVVLSDVAKAPSATP